MKPSKKQGGFLTGFKYPTFACLQATLNPAIIFLIVIASRRCDIRKKRMEYHGNIIEDLIEDTKNSKPTGLVV